MNILDLVLVGLAAFAVLGGLRAGFLARAASWAGLVLGIVLTTRTVPWMLELVQSQDPPLRLGIGIATFALTVSMTAAVAGFVGSAIRSTIAATPLGGIDRVLGAIASVAVLAGAIWLLVPAAADVPGTVAQQVRTSRVVATITNYAPDPPDAFRALRNLMDTSRFPEVFADLMPAPEASPPPDQIGVAPDIVEQALASTAHVRADGCGKRYEGSSFVIGDGLVMTNAHVVAGADEIRLRFPDGETFNAVVVVFDPERDLALLEVSGLSRAALAVGQAPIGAEGAVLGYPGGQLEPRVAPARFEARRDAIGRDIYGRDRAERRVVFLSARLRQGDSGSAVIDPDGRVGGVVFAVSPDNAHLAYALDVDEVEDVLASPREPGDSGACM